jgi:hypothetical protein
MLLWVGAGSHTHTYTRTHCGAAHPHTILCGLLVLVPSEAVLPSTSSGRAYSNLETSIDYEHVHEHDLSQLPFFRTTSTVSGPGGDGRASSRVSQMFNGWGDNRAV